jgi:hypothetical protein
MKRRGPLSVFLAAGAMTVSATSWAEQAISAHTTSSVAAAYGKLPLNFEANVGQSDPQVRFLSRGNGYSLFLTDSAAVLSLHQQIKASNARATTTADIKADVVRMELTNTSLAHRVTGEDALPGKVSYFIGNDPAKWHSEVPTYSRVRYVGVYPGVDLIYYGNQEKLEYDFVVAPEADPQAVKLHFTGVTRLTLDNNGELSVATKNGSLVFHRPVVYQPGNGQRIGESSSQRQMVDGKFVLLAGNTVGFKLGSYDKSRELVIDPTLAYSTYLGGSSGEGISGIAVDSSGDAYVTGATSSPDFPVTALFGPVPPLTNNEVFPPITFVSKFNSSGSGLIYSAFLGGSNTSSGNAIALDSSGHAYVTGFTTSSDFPVTSGAYETTTDGTAGFVTKLNEAGTQLLYSTYIRGVNQTTGIAIDPAHHAYVTGWTRQTNLAVTANAFQKTNHGQPKGFPVSFAVELDIAGNAAIYSTYLGGSGGDLASGIAVDGSGHAFVTGFTSSTDFPHTSGALQTVNKAPAAQGATNAFVTKLNPTGSGLVYSTYLGGSGEIGAGSNGATAGDTASGIAIDSAGDAYVAGTAFSADFPHTSDAFQTVNNGVKSQASNAFVAKLNPAGTQLIYSTFLGGSGAFNVAPIDDSQPPAFGDGANAIAIDRLGDAYVVGTAVSSDFPVTSDAFQLQDPSLDTNADGNNPVGFFAEINTQGSQLLYSTYLGGSGCGGGIGAGFDGLGDTVNAVSTGPFGDAFLGGTTCSGDFPVTNNAFQTVNRATFGGGTGFVTMFGVQSPSLLTVASSANPQQEGKSVTLTVHVQPGAGSGSCTGEVQFTANSLISPPIPLNNAADASFTFSNLPAGQQQIVVEYTGDNNCMTAARFFTETMVVTTTTTLSSSRPQSTVGQPVTFTAIVSSSESNTAPTGIVTFMNGSTAIGSAALKATLIGSHTVGVASFTTTALPVGTLKITAVYKGSALDDPSTSAVLTQIVAK